MWYENKVGTVGPEVNFINVNGCEVEEVVLELKWNSWIARIILREGLIWTSSG
jgi:hypothetical protein